MPDVLYYVASSLDGYIATADGGVDWLGQFENSGDDYGFGEMYSSVNALVMGSHTYEFTLAHGGSWKSPDKPSWVFTHRDLEVIHPSITLTSQKPAEVMESLDARGIERVWLMGGGRLATSFRMDGLISHYVVGLLPIVLGGGIPLFADGERQDVLELVEAKTFSRSGVVLLSYQRR